MKTLMLMRHGQDQSGGSLSSFGRNQVDSVAREIVEQGVVPDVIVHSPVPRAVETAQRLSAIFNGVSGKDVPLVSLIELGPNGNSTLLTRALDDSHSRVLAVAHEPNITALLGLLAEELPTVENARVFVTKAETEEWKNYRKANITQVLEPFS